MQQLEALERHAKFSDAHRHLDQRGREALGGVIVSIVKQLRDCWHAEEAAREAQTAYIAIVAEKAAARQASRVPAQPAIDEPAGGELVAMLP